MIPAKRSDSGIADSTPRLAQDVGLVGPAVAPAVEAHQHERALVADLGDVLVDRLPFRLEGRTGNIDPGGDQLVRDEHLGGEGFHLGDLFGRGVVGRAQNGFCPASRIRVFICSRTDAGIACS